MTVAEVAKFGLFFGDKDFPGEHTARITAILRERGWRPRCTGQKHWWELG